MVTYNKIGVTDDCEVVDTNGVNFRGALVVLQGPKY